MINKIDGGGLAVVHTVISSNTSMYERLDWRKKLKGERILFNAFKDMYFTCQMNFEKLST
jgi:hypothetical protein